MFYLSRCMRTVWRYASYKPTLAGCGTDGLSLLPLSVNVNLNLNIRCTCTVTHYNYIMLHCHLQAYWDTAIPGNKYTTDSGSDDDSECSTVAMTGYGGSLRTCGLDDGCVRVEFLVPDSEDLSGNTGLCGNANGDEGDDPDAGTDFGVCRLSPVDDPDDDADDDA